MKHLLTYILIGFSLVVFSQQDVPDAPLFRSASVVPGSNPAEVVLEWAPSDSLDVEGYYIFIVNAGGITNYLDTVYGRTTTTYSNQFSNASGQSETYRLAAFDTLGNISLLTDPHKTVYAFPYFDKCALKVDLDWNAYEGWNNVASYKVYRRKTGSDYTFIASVDGSETNYPDNNLEPNVQYCYYVEAIRGDGVKATSNQTCVYTSSYQAPEFLNLDYASVENGMVELRFTVDTAAEVIEYRLQKAVDTPANFTTIKTFTDNTAIQFYHTDTDTDPEFVKYYYRVQSINPCRNVSGTSNLGGNMILRVASDEQLNHYLDWDEYIGWRGNVNSYKIVKKYGLDAEQPIYTLTADEFMYSVNISNYVRQKHSRDEIVPYSYCYYILASEDATSNPYRIQGMSKTNQKCVSHQPRLYMPNIFFPSSGNLENRVFKPVVSFAVDDNYEFIVFNRWGEEVFRTTDQSQGWNGDTRNTEAHAGRYVYFVRYSDFDGVEFQKSGVFYLKSK
jgi:gliding motility-associated-like protein